MSIFLESDCKTIFKRNLSNIETIINEILDYLRKLPINAESFATTYINIHNNSRKMVKTVLLDKQCSLPIEKSIQLSGFSIETRNSLNISSSRTDPPLQLQLKRIKYKLTHEFTKIPKKYNLPLNYLRRMTQMRKKIL